MNDWRQQDLYKNLGFPNFLATFVAMIGFVTQFEKIMLTTKVNIIAIVLTSPVREQQKDARARVPHACVRSNHSPLSHPSAKAVRQM